MFGRPVFKDRIGVLRQLSLTLTVLCMLPLLPVLGAAAAAANEDAPKPESVPWREVWTGADATQDSWLIYSGMTLSPFSHIHAIAYQTHQHIA